MKATELQIGDLVKIKGHLDYDKVQEIARDENMQWYISFACSATLFRAYEFEPIPLTPEILEKNGWLNDPYSRLSLQDGKWLEFYWYEHRLQKYWEGTDEWQNHTKQLELVFKAGSIFYVHELQHALRLCGLNEIADNFKV